MSIDNQQYQPGDVVNGHRLSADGTAWEPITPAAPLAETAEQGNWFARHKVLTAVGGGVAAVLLIAGIANGGSSSEAADSTPAVEDAAGEQEAAPAAQPEQPAEPAEAAPVVFDPVTYTGSGDTILSIDIPATDVSHVVASFEHAGSSNFAVWSLDEELFEDDLLVNTIGSYSGQTITPADTKGMSITADGSWTVTLTSLAAAETFDGSITGSGDRVVIYTGDRGIADISHTGDSNFAVWAYPESGRTDLLVNEIGNYTGQGVMPALAVLVVSADGNWTITVQ